MRVLPSSESDDFSNEEPAEAKEEVNNEDAPSDDAEEDEPSPDLELNTEVEGEADESPEQVEAAITGTGPTTVVPVQGGTQLASSPVQEPVIPVAKPIAQVMPLSQVKILAAGLVPQHQVKNVRELMAEAAKRMNTAIVP